MRNIRGYLVSSRTSLFACASVILITSGCNFAPNIKVTLKPGSASNPSGSVTSPDSGASLLASGSAPMLQKTLIMGSAQSSVSSGGVAVDSSSNVIMVGTTGAGLDGNTLTGTDDVFVTKFDSASNKLWTRQLGVASHFASANAVATDSAGNIFVAGFTDGGLDGNTLTGKNDFYVAKYNSAGTRLWTRQLGAASKLTYGYSVATDPSGSVVVAGVTNGGLDGNTLTGTWDSFVTKYNSAGNKLWTKQFGVASQDTSGWSVATDSSGNVFALSFIDERFTSSASSEPIQTFVTKYDSAGAKIWTKQLAGGMFSSAITTDSSGNFFVTGNTSERLDGNTLTGIADVFVAKYDSMGEKLWIRQMGAASQGTFGRAIATDLSGNVYVTGELNDGDDPRLPPPSTNGLDGKTLIGYQDLFIVKYDSSGNRQWVIEDGTPKGDAGGSSIAVDSSGHVYIEGSVSLAGIDGIPLLGSDDAFVSKY